MSRAREFAYLPRFMLWAAIGYNYRSPIVILPIKDENDPKMGWRMTGDKYIELCVNDKFTKEIKKRNLIFMQDGARCHTCKVSMAHLRASGMHLLSFWPPQSPDLSPIENVWALLNEKIAAIGPKTLQELEKATVDAWNSITVEQMNSYVLSFQGKCEKVYEREAGKEEGRVMKVAGRPPGSKDTKPRKQYKKKTPKKSPAKKK